jgi:hypothetical protein
MRGRHRRSWLGMPGHGLNDLSDTDDASTLKHHQPDAGRDGWPEVTEQWMQSNHGFRAGVEPSSGSGFERQRGVVSLLVNLGRERPMRSVAGSDWVLATAFLMSQESQPHPDVAVLSLIRRPPLVLVADVHSQDCRLRTARSCRCQQR